MRDDHNQTYPPTALEKDDQVRAFGLHLVVVSWRLFPGAEDAGALTARLMLGGQPIGEEISVNLAVSDQVEGLVMPREYELRCISCKTVEKGLWNIAKGVPRTLTCGPCITRLEEAVRAEL
ncbi:hypothetical protein Ait01nite_020250 [Actinoplanes italicus]|uniref:Uncharacterized protein n=1 Tax=Actinoplanes italicus TaxID=113567 RepID=A0A2T0KPB4_9ACTN|nr:hypothetical protein [Actinoplanes italicus]PRX25576.1 hypothetical protein CLV67_101293 [Actinoplanes italicus]GIE28980.1 hypothetical protein Ait01nite_020250 [Actinoplanes italicus]